MANMKENTWYQLAPWNYIIKLDDVYFIYWSDNISEHISVEKDASEWIDENEKMYEEKDRWPAWKENLIHSVFTEDIYSPYNVQDD